MSHILVLQNSQAEGIGSLGRMMKEDGFELYITDAKRTIPDRTYDALVVLGGPQSANDKEQYLRSEEDAILRHADAGLPVIGICLGAQLAAKALGSAVYAGGKKEVGFYDDLVSVSDEKLFSGLGNFCAFHWHNDTFDLPKGAVRLVESREYKNQAFRHGTVVGLQFHLEADSEMVKKWLAESASYVNSSSHLDIDYIAQQVDERMGEVALNLARFYANFKSEFSL